MINFLPHIFFFKLWLQLWHLSYLHFFSVNSQWWINWWDVWEIATSKVILVLPGKCNLHFIWMINQEVCLCSYRSNLRCMCGFSKCGNKGWIFPKDKKNSWQMEHTDAWTHPNFAETYTHIPSSESSEACGAVMSLIACVLHPSLDYTGSNREVLCSLLLLCLVPC